jgi:hypothetical protein
LSKGIAIDIERAGPNKGLPEREPLLGVGLRKLSDELEVGIFDDG